MLRIIIWNEEIDLVSIVSAYLPKRQQRTVAGFLTRSRNSAFPSCDSDILLFRCLELTAAGTVQDSHLFPSQDFPMKILHHFAAAKIHFFSTDEISHETFW